MVVHLTPQPEHATHPRAADLLSVGLALTFATMDAAANHGNFTLNNMIACLIAAGEAGLCGLLAAPREGRGWWCSSSLPDCRG